LDESSDEKASSQSIGAGRQYNGRLGKVEISQTGVFLAFSTGCEWLWVDGELFLPEAWFGAQKKKLGKRLGWPKEREFATKIELGWEMIERVASEGEFKIKGVACDSLYGRSVWLRRKLAAAGLLYLAEVPVDTMVYLSEPKVWWSGRRQQKQEVSGAQAKMVRELGEADTDGWERIRVRATERGYLEDEFWAVRVWTLGSQESEAQEEWLVGRREENGRVSYALSNAAPETTLAELAGMKCERHFIECSNQEAKSELGWDELRAQKYPAWEHHLGLVILAQWYIVERRLEWARKYGVKEELAAQLGVVKEEMPRLSARNVRELLRAALPLPEMSVEEAAELVAKHLMNRVRVRRSEMKKRGYAPMPP
jgi:SRSO17 transposase